MKNAKPDALVFDLDGTLWDSCESVAQGWTQGLSALGIEKKLNAAQIASVCGLPTPDCIRKLCPEISETDLPQAMKVMGHFEREFLIRCGGALYPGVSEGLRELGGSYRLFLVSNCPEWYLRIFLESHQMNSVFKDWECFGRTEKPKADNLRLVALRNQLTNPIYFGDTESDLLAARAADYRFIYAAYGFGNLDFENAHSSFSEFTKFHLEL